MALCALSLSPRLEEGTFIRRPRFAALCLFPARRLPALSLLLRPFRSLLSHYTSFGRRLLATGYFNWIFAEAFFARFSPHLFHSAIRWTVPPAGPSVSSPFFVSSSSTDTFVSTACRFLCAARRRLWGTLLETAATARGIQYTPGTPQGPAGPLARTRHALFLSA